MLFKDHHYNYKKRQQKSNNNNNNCESSSTDDDMSLKCEEYADHTFSKKNCFSFSLVWFIF